MPTIGITTKPTFGHYGYGGTGFPNQNAELLTNTTGEAISLLTLGAWVGGWEATCRCRLIVWSASTGAVLATTAEFVVANEGAAGAGNVSQYEVDLVTPPIIANGASFYVGVARNRNDDYQISTGSTANPHYRATGSYPSGGLGAVDGFPPGSTARRTGMYVADYAPAVTSHSASLTLNAIARKNIAGTGKTLNAIVKAKPTSTKTLNAIVKARENVTPFGGFSSGFVPTKLFGTDDTMVGQQITLPISGVIDLVQTIIGKTGGSPTGTVEIALQADASGQPSGVDLAVTSFPASAVPDTPAVVNAFCHFPVTSGLTYWIVWRAAGNGDVYPYTVHASPWETAGGGVGAEFDGATWITLPFARNISSFLWVVSSTLTVNAIVKKSVASSATLNAIVRKSASGLATLNAIVKKAGSGSATIDADARLAGKAIWTTPISGIGMVSQPTLAFLMPAAVGDMFFQIELDTVNTFDSGDLTVYDSSVSQTGWQYWNGSSWVAVPGTGVPNTFSGNEARLTLPSPLDPGTWYRRVRAGV